MLFFLCLSSIFFSANAQKKSADSGVILRKMVMDGDTFYVYTFDEFILKEFDNKEQKRHLW